MSSLGLHVSGPKRRGFKEMLEKCAAAHSPVALVFSLNNNVYADVQSASPTTLLVYRDDRYGADPFNDAFFTLTPDQAFTVGAQWVDKYAAVWLLNPANFYGLVNEPGLHTAQAYKLYDAFHRGALTRAGQLGYRLALYGWSLNNPNLDLVYYLIPSLTMAKAGGHVLELHEYSGAGGMITDPPSPNVLRYRALRESLPAEARCDFIIGEAGPGAGYGTGLRGQAYVDDVARYDAEVMKDAYVKGVALFDLGNNESNMQEVLPQLGEYIASHPTPIAVDPPVIVETEPGTFCAGVDALTDAAGDRWTLGKTATTSGLAVLKNGAQFAGGWATALLYHTHAVYCTNAQAQWYQAKPDGWQKIDGDPRLSPVTPPVDPFWVSWPVKSSESPRITDKFNATRDYANKKHEGIDCDAYENSTAHNATVVAAQDGVVESVRVRGDAPSYGVHVVIIHPWGKDQNRYRTLYGHLSKTTVTAGQIVKRGDPIGIAGSSGTTAIHLHFGVYDTVAGLKGYARCIDCSADWPEGVIDPESVLRYDTTPPVNATAWRGLQLRADGHSLTADYDCLTSGKLNAAKIMTNTDSAELRAIVQRGVAADHVVLRLFWAGDNPALRDPARAFDEAQAWLKEFYTLGGRCVELHNEPNLRVEGMYTAWPTVAAWRSWFEGVARRIRAGFPLALIGWPGLSPKQDTTTDWVRDADFTAALQASVSAGLVDWIGAHAYWTNAAEMDSDNHGRYYRRLLGLGKPVLITEFANVAAWDDDATKGAQYRRYYSTLEAGVLGAFAFVSSASDKGFNDSRQTWARNGTLTAIPAAVGA